MQRTRKKYSCYSHWFSHCRYLCGQIREGGVQRSALARAPQLRRATPESEGAAPREQRPRRDARHPSRGALAGHQPDAHTVRLVANARRHRQRQRQRQGQGQRQRQGQGQRQRQRNGLAVRRLRTSTKHWRRRLVLELTLIDEE